MAGIDFDGIGDEIRKLEAIGSSKTFVKLSKKAVFKGSAVVALQIRKNIEALPTEPNRFLRDGDKFNVFTETNKQDLLSGLGISKIKEGDGGVYTQIGFAGYGSPETATKSYPNGLPNALIARSVERGTSVRRKRAFVKPAIKAAEKSAEAAMQQSFEDDINQIMKGFD